MKLHDVRNELAAKKLPEERWYALCENMSAARIGPVEQLCAPQRSLRWIKFPGETRPQLLDEADELVRGNLNAHGSERVQLRRLAAGQVDRVRGCHRALEGNTFLDQQGSHRPSCTIGPTGSTSESFERRTQDRCSVLQRRAGGRVSVGQAAPG